MGRKRARSDSAKPGKDVEIIKQETKCVDMMNSCGLQTYTAFLYKCALVLKRRPLQTIVLFTAVPIFVLITYAIDSIQYKDAPEDGFDSCGYPLGGFSDYYQQTNPFTAALIATGPIIAMLVAVVIVQDESKSGLLVAIKGNGNYVHLITMWTSWWSIFAVINFISCLVGAGIGVGIEGSLLHRVGFGALFFSLYLFEMATMFGFMFFVQLLCGFKRRIGMLVMVFILLFGGYFLATLSGSLSDDGPYYFQPQNTTQLECVQYNFSWVTGSGVCVEWLECTTPLKLPNGEDYTGCFYEAAAQDVLWSPSTPADYIAITVLFFFPSFHFTSAMITMISTSLLAQSHFDADDAFLRPPDLIAQVLGFDEPQIYAQVQIALEVELLPTFTTPDNVTSMLDDFYDSCPERADNFVAPGGLINSNAPSVGVSLGFLILLAFVYGGLTILFSYLRMLTKGNKRRLKKCPENKSNIEEQGASTIKGKEEQTTFESAENLGGLVVKNLSMSFGKKSQALDDVSFSVVPGSVLCIAGRNMAGKSTLVEILAGRFSQTSGTIQFNGQCVNEMQVGVCLQEDMLYNELTAEEHLYVWAHMRGAKDVPQLVDRWLKDVNLYDMKSSRLDTLSGGMRRRLCVALATIGTRDALIVLDEAASTAMDPVNRRYIWKHIQTVKQEFNTTIVLTTHAMEEAEILADQLCILDDGKVVATGSVLDLKMQYGAWLQISIYSKPNDLEELIQNIQANFAQRFFNAGFITNVKTVSSGYAVVRFHMVEHPMEAKSVYSSDGISLEVSSSQFENEIEKAVGDAPDDSVVEANSLVPSSIQREKVVPKSGSSKQQQQQQQQQQGEEEHQQQKQELRKQEQQQTSIQKQQSQSEVFADLLEEFIQWMNSEQSNVREFGMSNTTLDEVLLRILDESKAKKEKLKREGSKVLEVKRDSAALDVLADSSKLLTGTKLWLNQISALSTKNFHVRVFSWQAVVKWITAVVLLIAIIVVETTTNEIQADAIALGAVMTFLSVLLLPQSVYEVNNGSLQILKLHRCTFTAYASAESCFLWTVMFFANFISLTIFYIIASNGREYVEREILSCYNNTETSECACFITDNFVRTKQPGLRLLSVLEIENRLGSWGFMFAISLIFPFGLAGGVLGLNAFFTRHRVSAFVGGVLLLAFGIIPSVFIYRDATFINYSFPVDFLVDDESYYDDPDHNNNNHNNDYGNINVNRANLNFLTRTNHQDLLVDLVDRPMNPHDDNSLTRRLAHNTRGLEHLDPNSAKYKRILKRRQNFRIARKEERVRRRVQLRTLKRMMTDVHLRRGERTLDLIPDTPLEEEEIQDQDLTPQTICSRPTDLGTARDFNLLQQYSKRAKCPGTGPESDTKSILLIEGTKTFGRTGNNLIEFLHALQYSRDHDIALGIVSGSWAMRVLLKMWMAIQENNEEQWIDRFERAFCVKILKDEEELESLGYENVIRMETRDLFVYKTQTALNDYLGFQGDNLRTLWNEYNTGEGSDGVGKDVNDMCSGIDAVFGNDRETAIYSVIHSRSLEGEPGFKLLRNVSRKSGCDPVGALEMTPDYVKSILSPLGMLNYPIVFITDGQNSEVLERLQNDPDIGPQLRLVPEEASWVGGDITLAIMSNVFIGNPASTFSGFIAKSRLAMGFGHNYLFRARNDQGGWMTICGDDCIFDRSIMASMY